MAELPEVSTERPPGRFSGSRGPTLVALLTVGDPGRMTGGYLFHRRMADLAPRHGARVTFVSIPALPLAWAMLAGPLWVRAPSVRGADVVVLDSLAAAAAAPWLGRLVVPVIAMLHQPPGGMGSSHLVRRLRAPFDRWAYRHCRLLMLASDWLAEQLAAGGVDRGRIRVIPPGKDPAPDAESGGPESRSVGGARRATLRDGRRIAALCVASWLPAKGIAELLDALATLPDELVTLHLVGDTGVNPSYARRIRARLASTGLRDRVVVHGVLPPALVGALYRSADLFAMPSFEETYGTAWGEAMAAGLPIVGWRAGNLPFLAEHDQEALLAPPGDVALLAAHLRRLASDADARQRMGRAAALRSEARPTWDETARRFFAAIEEARMGGRSRRDAAHDARVAGDGPQP